MCTFIYERIYMKFLALHENAARGTSDFPIELYYVDRSHPRYEMPFHWHLEYEMMLDFLIKSSTDKLMEKLRPCTKVILPSFLPEPSTAVFLTIASMSVSYLTPAALWKAAAHCFTESTATFLTLIRLFILFLKKVLTAIN